MTGDQIVGLILLAAYLGRIAGAFFHDEDRSFSERPAARTKVREVVDAIAWPMSMFSSKQVRGMALSALRVMLLTTEYFVLKHIDWTGEWNGWKVLALLGAPLLLILEPLFSMIPVKELMLAAGAYLGSQIAGRVRTKETNIKETEPANPTPVVPGPLVAPPVVEEPHPVHEWADGDPHAGLG